MPIEINLRAGGAECPASVAAVSGYYLPDVAAHLALGLEPPIMEAGERHKCVASTNIHIDLEGVLLECSDEHLDAQATKLVTCVLFKESVGKKHVPNNGSQSCLGWIACGGNTLEEAEGNLQKALSQVSIRIK